ncbi:MAG: hypothetical protein P8144_02240 [Gammaproteobacteria bacterium]
MPQQNMGSTTVSPPQILHIAVPVPLTQTFSYLPPQDTPLAACQTGSRIWVHFRQKRLVGFIVGHGHADPNAPYQLRHAGPIIDTQPLLPPALWQTAKWAARYLMLIRSLLARKNKKPRCNT